MDEFLPDMDLIDRYLLGQLGDEELRQVESRMQREPEFLQQVEDARKIQQLVVATERAKLWQQLAEEEAKNKTGKHRFLSFSPTVWAAAASLLLMVALGGYWWSQQNKYKEIYLAYYKPYEELSFPKARGGTEADMALPIATEQYKEKKYTKCIDTLEPLSEKDDRVYFVLGLAYAQQEDFEKALENFDRVTDDFDLLDELRWYKALVFVAMKKPERAKELLVNIKQRKPMVEELLKQL